ncbi:MAG: hypothetical protein PHE48_03070 [Candidatus Daviesbacteria bacterium]|nr:hypothetical protein [Candidatus Daviesbacteria bacterium]
MENIIEGFVQFFDGSLDDPKAVNRAIGIAVDQPTEWGGLREAIGRHPYTGDNPEIMLKLYDALEGSEDGLMYGIQGLEILQRETSRIAKLRNPEGLVQYVIDTSEGFPELNSLQDALLVEGSFYTIRSILYNPRPNSRQPDKHLINSVLLVANEIDDRLKDVNAKEQEFEGKSFEEAKEVMGRFNMRIKARQAIVLAYQANGKKPEENIEALQALATYEFLSGQYQANGFDFDLMKAYAQIKYGTNKPSAGEVPDDFKIDPAKLSQMRFSRGYDFDAHFRYHNFGVKQEERERKAEEAKRGSDESRIEDLFENASKNYAEALELIGVEEDMSYEEARSIYRNGLKKRQTTFIRQDKDTPEYDAAMDEMKRFLVAWERIILVLYPEHSKKQNSL